MRRKATPNGSSRRDASRPQRSDVEVETGDSDIRHNIEADLKAVVEMGLYSGEGREPARTAARVSLEGKILHASGLWPAGKRTGEQAR